MSTPKHARRAMIRPDRPGMAVAAITLASVVAIAAFLVSFEALSHIGETLGLAWPWLVPVMIDLAILAATALLLVEHGRGHRGVLPWTIVYGATIASSAANGWSHFERGQGLAPSLTAALAPWLLLVLTHAIANVLVDGEHTEQAVEQAPEQTPEPQAFILRETPISRPSTNAEQPARRVGRDAETAVPELAEQPDKVTVPATVADAEQGPEQVETAVPEQVERDVPEAVEQPARPVPEAPARPTPNTPAKKAPSTRPSASSAADEQSREQAVAAVLAGMPKAAAAREFGVARATLQRAVAAAEAEREQVVAA